MKPNENYKVKRHKTFGFYLALILAIASIVGGILYMYYFSNLFGTTNGDTITGTFNYWIPVLMIAGGVIFIILACFRQDNIGTGILAICNFAAFIIFALSIYSYFIDMAMSFGTEGFDLFAQEGVIGGIIVIAIQLVTAIVGNILAWCHLNSNPRLVLETKY